MSRFYWLVLMFCCCLSAPLGAAHADALQRERQPPFAQSDAQFLAVDQAFHAYAWHDDERVYVGMRNEPGHYLYRHRFALESRQPGVTLGTLDLPPGEFKHDPYLGDVHVFHDRVEISAPLSKVEDAADTHRPIPVTLTFQGCADAGLCYPPEHWKLEAKAGPPPAAYTDATRDAKASPIGQDAGDPFSSSGGDVPLANPARASDGVQSTSAPIAAAGESSTLSSAGADGQFRSLLDAGIGRSALGLFFLAGLGLTFTPCVLPMLPILTAIIVGQNARRGRALALSASYVAGMAATFTLLGTLMGMFGASLNLQARLQSGWVLIPFALLFALFAIAMFGAFDLRLPSAIGQRIDAWQNRLQRSGPAGLAAAGALSVLVVSPCVSAPLAGALVFISTTGETLGGALALLALALGMGVPLILVGTFGGQWLPRTGAWMQGVKAVFGVMLLGVAIWLIERLLPGPVGLLLWGALTLGCALALGALDMRTTAGWPRARQAAGWALLVWGTAMIWGAAQGGGDPLHPLAETDARTASDVARPTFQTVDDPDQLDAALASARAAGRPVMVDVSADWCISCKVMEQRVFPEPAVADRLADFTLLRADVTRDVAASRELLDRYSLFGPPGLLFFSDGKEIRDARVQGEIDAPALVSHLEAVQRRVQETGPDGPPRDS
ncbi:MAG: protein-disulfide reductase DsbD [Salinicola sp.]|uniref:protein-disulfide reductase DsbD n=1 Tax=Salinicola sp. TaxID=1978524 RepID=UPI001DF9A662|nr:protein-disulfide reductase DsbD [Salinicola sp.]NRB55974.1 protein-disulfide reductase DsbD [Salinicola sp.]